jgi:magnesium chelatase subunit D
MKYHSQTINYPFTAIVGQEKLKKALLLCAVNPAIGGLLIQGDKGTAKSTAARALAEVLPYITNALEDLVPVPFINLPIGATEERIIGNLDLEAVLVEKKKKFQPGLLAAVHQGILYIDEVNLLPDHLVDVLLDVSAMGENRIEREGLSFSHPSRFTLIGTMNPEEGQLRPQFLDRFGLMVNVGAPSDVAERTEVVRRRIAFESAPAVFILDWELHQDKLKGQLIAAKELLNTVRLDDELLTLISELTTALNVKSLRADIVMYKTAITIAALDQRTLVTEGDIREAATLVLGHRSRKNPYSNHFSSQQKPDIDDTKRDDQGKNDNFDQSKREDQGKNDKLDQGKKKDQDKNNQKDQGKNDKFDQGKREEQGTNNKADQGKNDKFDQGNRKDQGKNDETDQGKNNSESTDDNSPQIFNAGVPVTLPKIEGLKQQSAENPKTGNRSAVTNVKRGLHTRSENHTGTSAIAIQETVIHALLRDPGEFEITMDDLHQKKRDGKMSNLILFIVDASGSMAARKRMEAVKGTVLSLLTEAYEKRDTVGVIAFRGIAAEVLLYPTQSIELAEEAMLSLPTGGRTPLADALQTAAGLLHNFNTKKGYHPMLIVLTDGKANVSLPGIPGDPWSQTLTIANQLKALHIQTLVLNSESNYFNLDKAEELAQTMGAQYLSMSDISEEHLTPIINQLSGISRSNPVK